MTEDIRSNIEAFPIHKFHFSGTKPSASMDFEVAGTPIEVTPLTGILILVGLALLTYGAYDYVQQSTATDDAVPVNATVVDASISQENRAYDVHVEFTYSYQGTRYRSDQVFAANIEPLYETKSEARSVLARYEPGTTVTAYVDPAATGEAFLRQRTTRGPLILAAFGGIVVVVNVLDAIGAQNPGQQTPLRPADEYEPTRYGTLFGIDRDTVHRTTTRLITASLVLLVVSLLAVTLLTGARWIWAGLTAVSMDVTLSDSVGLLFVTAFAGTLVLTASAALYTMWSFTEYRRLRERIPEPRPPSPFRHPTRLVTISLMNDELDEYGTRVKRTGFAIIATLFSIGFLSRLLVL